MSTTLDQALQNAIAKAIERFDKDECYWCSDRNCWEDDGKQLVCKQTKKPVELGTVGEARFATRAAMSVLKRRKIV